MTYRNIELTLKMKCSGEGFCGLSNCWLVAFLIHRKIAKKTAPLIWSPMPLVLSFPLQQTHFPLSFLRFPWSHWTWSSPGLLHKKVFPYISSQHPLTIWKWNNLLMMSAMNEWMLNGNKLVCQHSQKSCLVLAVFVSGLVWHCFCQACSYVHDNVILE